MSEWTEITLGELINIQHGFAFKGKYFRDEPPGDILLTPGNFAIGGGFKTDKLKFYHGPVPEEYVLREGDLIVTMTDLSKNADTLGYPAIVPSNSTGQRFLHNQRLGKVIVKDNELVDSQFLHYLMCSPEYRHEVVAGATGTTVKHTSPSRIQQFRFLLPPLPEQRAIAHVLGTLDDKIELNRRMNKTLERMAQVLFKSWFVDFDPVRAKMDGRPTGLPPELDALFPDALVESALREIPVGWEVVPLDEIAIYQNGLALQKYPAEEGEDFLYRLKIRELRQGYFDDRSERSSPDIRDECIVYDGDVIFSWSGSLLIDIWTGRTGALNQHLFKVTSDRFPRWFYYLWTSHHLEAFQRIAADKATTMGHIKRHHLSEALTVVPPSEIIRLGELRIAPLLERLILTRLQSRSLAEQRDLLLPRLISGEQRIK